MQVQTVKTILCLLSPQGIYTQPGSAEGFTRIVISNLRPHVLEELAEGKRFELASQVGVSQAATLCSAVFPHITHHLC